jgi:hypothetical protein
MLDNTNKNEINNNTNITETETKKAIKKKYVYNNYNNKILCNCGLYHTIWAEYIHKKTITHKIYINVNKIITILD